MKRLLLLLLAVSFALTPAGANTLTPNYSLNKPAVNDPVDEDLWGTLLNSNFDTIDTELDGLRDNVTALESAATDIPVGTVSFFAGTSAPTGWLLGYGQAISRVTYDDLFGVIGTTYGVGDGSTTFNVPDCRGRTLAGQDDMGGSSANRLTGVTGSVDGDVLGGTGGTETHTLAIGEIPAQSFSIYGTSPGATATGFSFSLSTRGGSPLTVTSDGGGGAHNNVPPTLILNCIIHAGE